MMPKRGLSKYPTRISPEALASEEDHVFIALVFMYTWIDCIWCPNIFFTTTEPLDDSGNISVLLILI